jgi:hypothetical protein
MGKFIKAKALGDAGRGVVPPEEFEGSSTGGVCQVKEFRSSPRRVSRLLKNGRFPSETTKMQNRGLNLGQGNRSNECTSRVE